MLGIDVSKESFFFRWSKYMNGNRFPNDICEWVTAVLFHVLKWAGIGFVGTILGSMYVLTAAGIFGFVNLNYMSAWLEVYTIMGFIITIISMIFCAPIFTAWLRGATNGWIDLGAIGMFLVAAGICLGFIAIFITHIYWQFVNGVFYMRPGDSGIVTVIGYFMQGCLIFGAFMTAREYIKRGSLDHFVLWQAFIAWRDKICIKFNVTD